MVLSGIKAKRFSLVNDTTKQFIIIKDNQAVKLGQLLKYKKRNIFFRNHTENEVGQLVPDLLGF